MRKNRLTSVQAQTLRRTATKLKSAVDSMDNAKRMSQNRVERVQEVSLQIVEFGEEHFDHQPFYGTLVLSMCEGWLTVTEEVKHYSVANFKEERQLLWDTIVWEARRWLIQQPEYVARYSGLAPNVDLKPRGFPTDDELAAKAEIDKLLAKETTPTPTLKLAA